MLVESLTAVFLFKHWQNKIIIIYCNVKADTLNFRFASFRHWTVSWNLWTGSELLDWLVHASMLEFRMACMKQSATSAALELL